MKITKLGTLIGALVLAAPALPSSVLAQDFPNRPIRVVVPYNAGGPVDLVARVLQERMRAKLPQAMVVENRSGANTAIGGQVVKNTPASGYNLLMGTNSVLTNTLLMKDPGYTVEDFEPIAPIGVLPIVFTASPTLPVKSVADFVSYFKARPGQGNYGSAGSGTELLVSRFIQAAGLEMTSIPYRGGAEATNAVAAGQVQMWPSGVAAAIGLIRDGKLIPLAIAGDQRTALLPDVPTFKEAGYPTVVGSTLIALMARSGTPAAELQILRDTVVSVVESEEYRKTITGMGIDPWTVKPQDLPAAFRQDLTFYEQDVKRLGLQKQ